jgi:predicted nuclease of predicted toxin-antitoxin system
MKIYADEIIERSIIEGLKRRKIEIVSVRELGYVGKPDEFHIKKASEIKAIILTHDVDFLRIASRSDIYHIGIIFSHPKNVSIGQCIRGVELVAKVLTDKDMKNHIEFL